MATSGRELVRGRERSSRVPSIFRRILMPEKPQPAKDLPATAHVGQPTIAPGAAPDQSAVHQCPFRLA